MWTQINKDVVKHLALVCCLLSFMGCRAHHASRDLDLVPARDVLNASCCEPDTETQINFLTLRRSPPREYVLDKGDTLGIYIQGITGDKDVPPPVHFPEANGGNPALGYPVPVRDDGYISLPLISPVPVSGLTVAEAESKIVRAYTQDKKILLEGNEKIIVTLMKRRTYNVLVIREDITGNTGGSQSSLNRNQVYLGENKQTESFSIELPAYENDVLHALSETGGMPGETAKNEIVVLRGGMNQPGMGSIVQAIGSAQVGEAPTMDQANIVRIPVKGEPGSFPNLSESDITLEDGDVLYIEGREREVFYTGGLLEGGRFPLPRDYDIDVLEAMSMAGGSVSAAAGSGGGLSGGGGIMPATQVTVLRKCGCEQVAIDVDLRYAMANPSERIIIQPGDMIILEYRRNELVVNSIASMLRFGGIYSLFR